MLNKVTPISRPRLSLSKKLKMVLADLGRKITTALRSLSNATVINEEVGRIFIYVFSMP